MSNKTLITMEIVFEFDPETNEYTSISQKIIDNKKIKKTTKPKIEEIQTDNPGLIREDSKLILNDELVSLLDIQESDRIYIGYDKVGTKYLPFIGKDDKKGNKITKSNTVSYRGKANMELSAYGTIFKISEGKHKDTFYLIGDIENTDSDKIENDMNISVNEPSDIDLDNPFDIDMNKNKITQFTFNDIELE